MSFLVFGGDPFVLADICELLVADFPGYSVSAPETEEDLFEAAVDQQQPLVLFLVQHRDVVRIANGVLDNGARQGAVVLVRNDPPSDDEKQLPLHHLAKPFSSRELSALINSVLSAQLASQS